MKTITLLILSLFVASCSKTEVPTVDPNTVPSCYDFNITAYHKCSPSAIGYPKTEKVVITKCDLTLDRAARLADLGGPSVAPAKSTYVQGGVTYTITVTQHCTGYTRK